MITLCGTLCGFDDWVSIEDFAHENEAWLRQFLPLANGIPFHDTLGDVMGASNAVLSPRPLPVGCKIACPNWEPAMSHWMARPSS